MRNDVQFAGLMIKRHRRVHVYMHVNTHFEINIACKNSRISIMKTRHFNFVTVGYSSSLTLKNLHSI